MSLGWKISDDKDYRGTGEGLAGFCYLAVKWIQCDYICYIGSRQFTGNWRGYPGGGSLWNEILAEHGKDDVERYMLSVHRTVDDMLREEKRLHQQFDVVNSPLFANLIEGDHRIGAVIGEAARMRMRVAAQEAAKGKLKPVLAVTKYGNLLSLSNEAMADALGIASCTLSNWIAGRRHGYIDWGIYVVRHLRKYELEWWARGELELAKNCQLITGE